MSHSATYRRTFLTETQRAAILEVARAARTRDGVMPSLRRHVEQQVTRLGRSGALAAGGGIAVAQRIAAATSPEELRTIARDLPAATYDSVVFDLTRLRGELAGLRQAVGEVDGPEIEVALAEATTAVEAVGSVDPSLADAALSHARLHLATLGAVVEEALIEAERRTRTTAAVVEGLAVLGYEVTSVEAEEGATVVEARHHAGRAATVVVGAADGLDGAATPAGPDADGVHADFTDPGDAVDLDDDEAGEICHPAVLDAVDFHRQLGRTDLGLGPVEAQARPTRGIADRPIAAEARRRPATRRRPAPPATRTRS